MRYLAAVLGIVLLTNHAAAVIIVGGNGSGNTTAPPNDPGFANVGVRGGGTAVYLDDGWVLTAAHVGAGSTLFNNTWYSEVPNSAVQLANPPGQAFTPYTDLLLYKIQGNPNLPSIPVGSDHPVNGWQVTMIGNGHDRNASLAYWTSSWAPASGPSTYAGYIWADANQIRWGTNVIDSVGIPEGIGNDSQTAFRTTFNSTGTPYEDQGSIGDSGGAVFHQGTSGGWTLAGIMFTINNIVGQPQGTSVFGDMTYSADLSVYRSEIYHTMALPGDVNFDGVVNGLDLSLVASEWLAKGSGASDPPGDANHDGVVNGLDIALLMSHWTNSQSGGGGLAVPEPSMFVLAALSGVGLLVCRRFTLRTPKRH